MQMVFLGLKGILVCSISYYERYTQTISFPFLSNSNYLSEKEYFTLLAPSEIVIMNAENLEQDDLKKHILKTQVKG